MSNEVAQVNKKVSTRIDARNFRKYCKTGTRKNYEKQNHKPSTHRDNGNKLNMSRYTVICVEFSLGDVSQVTNLIRTRVPFGSD